MNNTAAKRMLGVVVVLLMALPLQAQDITYTQKTSVKLPGMLGDALSMLGGAAGDLTTQEETIYLKGNRMRTDQGDQTTVFDLDERRVIRWDHSTEQYTIQTFDELAAQISEARQEMASMDEDEGEERGEAVTEAYALSDARLDLSVNPTGRREKKNKFSAEQVIMTMQGAKVNETTDEFGTTEEAKGSIVAVSDMWVTQSLEEYASVQAFQQRLAEEMGNIYLGKEATGRLQSAFDRDPRMKTMMDGIMAEASEVEGVPVYTTTHLVWVPNGHTYDESQVLEPPKKKRRRGLGGLVRRALENQTGVSTSTGGTEAPETKQAVLMSVVTEIESFKTGTLNDAMFMPPSTFQEEE